VAKISRPVMYVVALGVVAYAAVLLTEPEKPAKKPTARTTARTADATPKGFTEEDLNAKFERYVSKGKDAFKPQVVSLRALQADAAAAQAAAAAASANGVWVLTGITAVDGVRSALVENGATGDSRFLKVGDQWGGMRVASIETNAVLMAAPDGRISRLGFVESLDDAPGARAPGAPAPGALPGRLPSGVSPMPVVIARPTDGTGGAASPAGAATTRQQPPQAAPAPEAAPEPERRRRRREPDAGATGEGPVLRGQNLGFESNTGEGRGTREEIVAAVAAADAGQRAEDRTNEDRK